MTVPAVSFWLLVQRIMRIYLDAFKIVSPFSLRRGYQFPQCKMHDSVLPNQTGKKENHVIRIRCRSSPAQFSSERCNCNKFNHVTKIIVNNEKYNY